MIFNDPQFKRVYIELHPGDGTDSLFPVGSYVAVSKMIHGHKELYLGYVLAVNNRGEEWGGFEFLVDGCPYLASTDELSFVVDVMRYKEGT